MHLHPLWSYYIKFSCNNLPHTRNSWMRRHKSIVGDFLICLKIKKKLMWKREIKRKGKEIAISYNKRKEETQQKQEDKGFWYMQKGVLACDWLGCMRI